MRQILKHKQTFWHILLIFAAVFLAYLNALSNNFVYDDFGLLVKNPLVKGLQNIPTIFTTGYWTSSGGSGGLYRPLTMLSFSVEYSLAGLNPFVYHLDNVILHLLCCVLVYFISKTVLKEEVAPLFAALLFAVHPVHTEAVTWVSGRAELLSVFLFLLSAWLFLKKSDRYPFVLASAFIFFLALLAKETAVTLPLFLALYMVLYDDETKGKALVSKLAVRISPYIASFVIYLGVRAYILKREMTPALESAPLNFMEPYQRFLTICQSFYEYIRLSFIPTNLSADYYFIARSLLNIKVLLPLLIIILTAAYALKMRRYSRDSLFAILLFFIALLPVSNIIPIGVVMSERALYLPSVGVCMLLGIAFSRAGSALNKRTGWKINPIYLVFAIVLVAFTALTVNRNPFWKDEKEFTQFYINTMRERTKLFPDNAVFHTNLGKALVMDGNHGPEPEKELKEAIRLSPADSEAHFWLGMLYDYQSKPESALAEIQASIKMRPKDDAYDRAGVILYELGRNAESERMLDIAIRLNPYREESYVHKGVLRYEAGDNDTAFQLFSKAEMMDPADPMVYLKQGMILGTRKQFGAAISRIKKADELDPNIPEVHYYLAVAYTGAGNTDLAEAELKKALSLKPDYSAAKDLLAKVHRN